MEGLTISLPLSLAHTLPFLSTFSSDCTDGMVMLINGTSSGTTMMGTVGVCVNNNYRSICYDFWDQFDAQVVCSQLNQTGCE